MFRLLRSSLILLSFIFVIYGCQSSNTKKSAEDTLNRNIDDICFLDISNAVVDSNSGCPSFLLHREIQNYNNHVLVIKANRFLFEKNICYELTVGEYKYKKLLFDIFIDIYSSNGLQKMYCGDIDIANIDILSTAKCISGKVKCIIQSLETNKEIITLELTDAVFIYKKKKIEIKKIVFKNILISERGG